MKSKYLKKFGNRIILCRNIKGVHRELYIINNISWEAFLIAFKNNNIYFDPSISIKKTRCNLRTSVKFLLSFGYLKISVANNSLVSKVVLKQ